MDRSERVPGDRNIRLTVGRRESESPPGDPGARHSDNAFDRRQIDSNEI